MDNRGQLSLELIIVAFAVIALAAFMFLSMQGTASNYKEGLTNKSNELLVKIEKFGK